MDQKNCGYHALIKLAQNTPEGYRYRCLLCGKMLKLHSGVIVKQEHACEACGKPTSNKLCFDCWLTTQPIINQEDNI